ncbi:hypothetical protein Pmi06nite_68930 [Planotetraspora mira]|uniref:Uncharacterized protein n=1 Tax=Planotetraspora mira TaxID=58121 RepID=A0A8J3TWS0_9ACTN|nr:hypothetical protein Pmi06nite_68930 [Planotetraspora mira]
MVRGAVCSSDLSAGLLASRTLWAKAPWAATVDAQPMETVQNSPTNIRRIDRRAITPPRAASHGKTYVHDRQDYADIMDGLCQGLAQASIG